MRGFVAGWGVRGLYVRGNGGSVIDVGLKTVGWGCFEVFGLLAACEMLSRDAFQMIIWWRVDLWRLCFEDAR